MPTTYQVVNGQLEITETRPPRVRTIGAVQLNRRINQLNIRIDEIDNQLAALQDEKIRHETTIAELTPFIGQI
jgi:hypothetical protein